MKRSLYFLLFSCLVVFFVCLQPVSGQPSSGPSLPHEFYGKVFIGNIPAGMGLEVEAVGPGVYSLSVEMDGRVIAIEGNPVTTMTEGVYGEPAMSSQKLLVQGDIEPGTPLEFYVGGVKAEVYPVLTGGPWKENYSYLPGEITELDLRIEGQPALGQTREPTPVQTRLPASAVEAFLPEPGLATGRPSSVSTMSPPAGNNPPGTPGGTPVQGTPPVPTGGQSIKGISGTPLLFGIVILLVLVIVGGVYVMMRKRAGGKEEEEEMLTEKNKEE
jgi:hypothetical protein